MPSKDARATLATVARSAGVSVATVSKVVNGRADVGPATRALVESLLQQHEYVGRRPPPSARRSEGTPKVELMFAGDLNAPIRPPNQGVTSTVAVPAGAVVDGAVYVRTRSFGEPFGLRGLPMSLREL